MARQISYETRTGLTAPRAYARISRIRINDGVLGYNVDLYADAAARESDLQTVESLQFELPLPQGTFDPFAVCYGHLKTTPTFAVGSDV